MANIRWYSGIHMNDATTLQFHELLGSEDNNLHSLLNHWCDLILILDSIFI